MQQIPLFFQILVWGLVLACGVAIAYALLYIAHDLEDSALRPMGRFIKAFLGGLFWAIVGVAVAAVLFGIGIVVRAIFFRPLFSYYIYQFWAYRVGLVIVGLYLLWGIYYGAKNRLPLSYKFHREES
jgi:hypothetical protein